MLRRASITGFIFAATLWPFACYAQQSNPASPKRIGLLEGSECSPSVERWWLGRLAELGWSKGTIVFECVSIGDHLDKVPLRAHELVLRRPDVVMAVTAAFVQALKRETTTIPIVMLATWEPVRFGLITSLAQPGGNVTGVGWYSYIPKQIELLKEIVPHLKRVAIVGSPLPNHPPEVGKIADEYFNEMKSVLGIDWKKFPSVDGSDYDEIFARIAAEHFDAVHVGADPWTGQHAVMFAGLALRHRLPTATGSSFLAKEGLLLSYAQNWFWSVARASEYVDKILRGAKPSDLAVEEAPKFELVINLKTAKVLGLTVPPSLLDRADEVIE